MKTGTSSGAYREGKEMRCLPSFTRMWEPSGGWQGVLGYRREGVVDLEAVGLDHAVGVSGGLAGSGGGRDVS
ncbi:MAG: hypothetical protein ACE1Z6_07990 [Candidatus Methylomirabilales bacterium]|nr:hypothetical protein [candidate division NC10 bacterium]